MSDTPTVLRKILERKKQEVAQRKGRYPLSAVKNGLSECPATRGFETALRNKIDSGLPAVIAEVKKASPSKGVIRPDFNPEEIAVSYQRGGAACLSVLTDIDFFQGADSYLRTAKAACQLPVLRKDFIVDPYQIYESRLIGADCILLIAAALSATQMSEYCDMARQLDLDVLAEVHNEEELDNTLPIATNLVGINNRNLHTFEVTLDTTFGLLEKIPQEKLVITESGIHSRDDVRAMQNHHVNTFLVGESFMRATDPGEKLKELFFNN